MVKFPLLWPQAIYFSGLSNRTFMISSSRRRLKLVAIEKQLYPIFVRYFSLCKKVYQNTYFLMFLLPSKLL
jgi:hypothetical protein